VNAWAKKKIFVKEAIFVYGAHMESRARTITEPAAVEALAHPIRRRVLEALRSPDSAAAVARAIGLPRQKVNYHLKELARAKLVQAAGERRKGQFIEKLYEAVAGTFVVSPQLAWDDEKRQGALRDQISLRRLVGLGAQLQQDASGLLDRAAFDGEEIPSASVEAAVRFADEQARRGFMEEYLEALGPLLTKYGARRGREFRVSLAVYPDPEED
jgi:DNA-binding transcriptional ArsR family regulator